MMNRTGSDNVMEEAMGNSMEMTGSQQAPRSDGASGPPRSLDREQGLKDQTISKAQTLVDKAKSTAQERVRSAAQNGKTQAVETVSSLAQSLLVAGQQLQDQQSSAAKLVEQAAERLDRAANYLETANVDDVIRRTETWARQNPAAFVAGAFLVGVLGARFLKSSSPPASQSGVSGTPTQFSDREISRSPVVEGP